MAARHRFFLPPEAWDHPPLRLSGDEAHHCARVFRHQPGDLIEIFDGAGRFAPSRIVSVDRSEVLIEPESVTSDPQPLAELILVQALTKAKTMESIIARAVEFGVASIVPLATSHSVLAQSELERKPEKWRRLALEACKQCGQNRLPVLSPVLTPDAFLELPSSGFRLIGALHPDARPLRHWLPPSEPDPVRVTVAIGPEGDWSEAELTRFLEHGFLPLHLGPLILRAETAALTALAILAQQFLTAA